MSNISLRDLPITSFDHGQQLKDQALARGITEDHLSEIVSAEISNAPPVDTYAKAKITGLLGAVVFAISALSMFGNMIGTPAQAAVLLVIALLSLWFHRFGVKQEKLAALPAAVLRAHATTMTREEISVLKDHQALAGDRDAWRLLNRIQESHVSAADNSTPI